MDCTDCPYRRTVSDGDRQLEYDCDRECIEAEPDYGAHGYDTVRDERMEGLR